MISTKQLLGPITKVFSTTAKQWSAVNILFLSLLLMTPLCGFLFKCSCDWPWSGLAAKCNFYISKTEHQCPWCVSMTLAILSIGIAVIVGLYISTISLPLTGQETLKQVIARTVYGLLTFILLATVFAGLLAFLVKYPFGMGEYFLPPFI